MKKDDQTVILSAADLVGHLNCNHLTALDLQVATGSLKKTNHYDPLLEILRERGRRHEQAYLDHLRENDHSITIIKDIDITEAAVQATLSAMRAGQEIIVQAALHHGRWSGRADILRRVEKSSDFGSWSYEIYDTKLATETKGGTILQLCLYADLLSEMQGVVPENIYVVSPWSDFKPQKFRFADYAAYYRRVKAATEAATVVEKRHDTYPDPNTYCDICRWRIQCDQKRRDDDHLCIVAGIFKNQIAELKANGFETTQSLAELPIPLPFTPRRGSPLSFEKAKHQAAIQVQARKTGKLKFELLEVVPGFGLTVLPEPSHGDVFFDIEGDPFVGEHGLEYLFGYVYTDEKGKLKYTADWAFDRENEKVCFERFVDFVTDRREVYPDMHIYHFAPYEPSALKRLMGRYASREDQIDNLLRRQVFIDLFSIVRNAIRASVESYSIKKLEPFFGYERKIPLHDANVALTKISAGLELNDAPSIDEDTKQVVKNYNADDCYATHGLRNWLEDLRKGLIEKGQEIPRPPLEVSPDEELNEQQQRIQRLIERLTQDVPVDPEERTEEQKARWILAYILDWHRRENKAAWWEYFRLADLTPDELISEKAAIAHLTFVETVDSSPTGIPTHRYHFEQQDTDLRGDENLKANGGDPIGTAVDVSTDDRTINIKKSRATANIHPEAVFAHTVFRTEEQAASLFRIGEYVADHGIEGDGPFRSARDLLLRKPINIGTEAFQNKDEDTLTAALRISKLLDGGVLPVQGPPGTGKSFTGARMICKLIERGKKVGITTNSHKVIRNLIDKVIEAADERSIDVRCIQKPKNVEPNQQRLFFTPRNEDIFNALANNTAQVAGGTHFLWSREDALNTVDVLVVDEAGQMSLANVLAVASAAQTLILLGDPQQLEQPIQGTHPEGTGVSALDHILGGHQTILPEQGLFLGTGWRLHPDICAFDSEIFYESKLTSVIGCEEQVIVSDGLFSGAGLRYVPISHTGNTSASIEEADAVEMIVKRILASSPHWTNRDKKTIPLTINDILIIAPYNAQVFEIKQRLPDARVGTVDKFQGQEAPIAIYSMATSSHSDAPRGMEFLYSANRFNVAISRAKCMVILVASPYVFEADCRTPRQMELANAFCRYLEVCDHIEIKKKRIDGNFYHRP